MKRILIANRGEIARRVIATAQRMGIETVAVYSEPDAGALHVCEATQAFALGGRTSAESYLRVERLLEAARVTGADAVHPGYGFLSEDAGFAQAVVDAGLTWIGPPPAAIRTLGSKAAAKALALAHGVPCLPGYAGDDQSEARFIEEAARVGYPVMVKAVAGGGGRGMRLVLSADQLPAALASARAEALAGFGNGDLLIERALLRPQPLGQGADRVRTGLPGDLGLGHFNVRMGPVDGGADVGVDFGPQGRTNANGSCVSPLVLGDNDQPLGNLLPDLFGTETFIGGDGLHLRGDLSPSCS